MLPYHHIVMHSYNEYNNLIIIIDYITKCPAAYSKNIYLLILYLRKYFMSMENVMVLCAIMVMLIE